MSRTLLGLDIGTKHVKAVELQETKDSYRIVGCALAPLDREAELAPFIRNFLDENGLRTKRVVTAVSGRSVIVRYITMARMDEDQLQQAIRFEAGKYIPFEVDECILDSQILDEEETGEGEEGAPQGDEMRVLLVAAKRSYIDEHVNVLEQASLKPAVIDVDSFALGNLYEMTGRMNEQAVNWSKVVGLINIGASKTNINVVKGGNSFFTREIYIGGNDFTEAICKKLGVDSTEAERMKMDPESESAVRDATFSVVEDLCHELNLSIDFFENQYDRKVDDYYLCGGGSNQIGLSDAFLRFFDTTPIQWNPATAFEIDPDRVNIEAIKQYGTQLSVALGLASRVRSN